MEILKTKNINLRIIAVLLTFFIAVSPFANIRKVKAEFVLSGIAVTAIVGILLTALASQGDISGDYTVTAPQLDAIQQTAQGLLVAGGAGAIDQANKLGEALKSGAESAKIKALASGAVIYAFLQAIQETLFPKQTIDESMTDTLADCTLMCSAGPITFYSNVRGSYAKYYTNFPVYSGWYLKNTAYTGTSWSLYNDKVGTQTTWYSQFGLGYIYLYDTETKKCFSTSLQGEGLGAMYFEYPDSVGQERYKAACDAVFGLSESVTMPNVIYNNTYVSNLAGQETVTVPSVLPQTIINNITNWDGTSDLVLSPPLPYDIPDDEALVVDPTYGGEVIDPTDPVDPPAEEGTIVLPWLAALLGLLGLGNPSLEGIEAGVKTAIDKLIEGITATAQDVFDGSKEIFGNITDALTGIDAGIQSGIDALTGSISVPLANIADFALSVPDFFAIPEGKSIATPIIEQIPQVFPIVDQMNTALNKITVETRPLIIYYPYLDGTTKEINLNWYEPAREQVKHGVGLLFKVVTALACFAMVSNVFGIGIRVGAGQAYTDNNSGGGNSRKKED